jgi:hypothetical protein
MQDTIDLLVKARNAYTMGNLEEVMAILQDEVFNDNSKALFIKGEVYYKLQEWGDALNCFLACSEKEPSNISAKTYIEMIRNILGFRNTDFLNP